MSPCFQRPWFCTAALGAPAATILRAMPIRPLWPVNPSPRPAARAAARTRLARASPVSPKTGLVSVGSCFLISVKARAVARGHCNRCRLDLVLALADRDPAGAVGPELHIAPGEGGRLRAAEASVGQDSDDGQVHGGALAGSFGRFHLPASAASWDPEDLANPCQGLVGEGVRLGGRRRPVAPSLDGLGHRWVAGRVIRFLDPCSGVEVGYGRPGLVDAGHGHTLRCQVPRGRGLSPPVPPATSGGYGPWSIVRTGARRRRRPGGCYRPWRPAVPWRRPRPRSCREERVRGPPGSAVRGRGWWSTGASDKLVITLYYHGNASEKARRVSPPVLTLPVAVGFCLLFACALHRVGMVFPGMTDLVVRRLE